MATSSQPSPSQAFGGQQSEQGSPNNDERSNTTPIALGSDVVLMSANQDIRSQIEILQRTITLVFWYKPNAEPLRLQHPVPTFPLFQLSRFPSLTTDLGLTPTTYLDTYNRDSRQWDQHTISTVRVIDGHPRLLYRIRKSLLEALSDDECIGLKDEIETQLKQRPTTTLVQSPMSVSPTSPVSSSSEMAVDDKSRTKSPTLKRAAPSSGSDATGPPTKVMVMDGYPRQQQQPYPAYLSAPAQNGSSTSKNNSTTPEQSSPQSPKVAETRPSAASPSSFPPSGEQPASATSPTSPQYYNNANGSRPSSSQYLYQTPTTVQYNTNPTSPSSSVPLPAYLVHPPAAAPLIPYHPHPPLKRWPNDYTVSELSAGFQAMEALVHQTPNGGAAMTQRMAFERVFGSRYVKSTVCRHRGVWRKAPQALREEFEAMGEDERACWGEFVRRVEGRPPGRINGPSLIPVHELPYQLGAQQPQVNGSNPQGHTSTSGASGASSHTPNGTHSRHEEEEEDDDDDAAPSPRHTSAIPFNIDETRNTNSVHTQSSPNLPNANVSVYRPAIAVAGK